MENNNIQNKSKYIKIFENNNFIVEFNKNNNKYKVTYFEEGHYVEEVTFPSYLNTDGKKIGYWFLLDDCSNEGVYCSICRKKVYRKEYANQKLKSPFCPNCGSEMAGEFKVL